MSREQRRIEVAFTVDKPENLPGWDEGRPMYADDVYTELTDVVRTAVGAWYQARGRDLLTSEPLI